MELSQIQKIVFVEYKENGYLSMWQPKAWFETDYNQRIRDIAELSLIVTEVSEAIEEIRKPKHEERRIPELAKECADIIIRTLNFMSRKEFNAEKIILHKNKININRGKLHGKCV